jgi:ketosteroid isomerase-like protein
MTNAERGQIQAEVMAWADQFLEAATNLDAAGVAALFDQDDGHFMAGTTYRPNSQAHFDGTQELYAGWDAWEAVWGTKRIDVLSPEAALFVGETSGTLMLRDGSEFDRRTAMTFVLRKKDGVWRGLYGHAAGASTPRE